ncbi:hypothetical protein AMK59_5316 [Oryctes borbonicus]|uniref:Proline-rich transmembrane protein 3/4 domain-containing protein n=1 Tax=Oryctes borbonicus TaxID=1629725 RepID=A0A0T6B322_9SCAR|nr:hypothetical protein AMK59_5316 [Oryctes borbonicus]
MSDQIQKQWNIRDNERSSLVVVSAIRGNNIRNNVMFRRVKKMFGLEPPSNREDDGCVASEKSTSCHREDDADLSREKRDTVDNASEYNFSCDLILNNNINRNDNTQHCYDTYSNDIKRGGEICSNCKYYHNVYHSTYYTNLVFCIYVMIVSLYPYLFNMCLYFKNFVEEWSSRKQKRRIVSCFLILNLLIGYTEAFGNEFDKSEHFLDKINLEQSIAAVFNKVAYGSTTKRSIPDNAYPVTTLATPLLTTYRYSDGSDEFYRVDIKKPGPPSRPNFDYDPPDEPNRSEYDSNYGSNLEKDHVLPTTAPAADILKNNNNKNYENPNRYNNDRLKPNFELKLEQVTESAYRTTTGYNGFRNVRPTKSMYSKDVPNYVPPSRAFFTPPLPPEYLNPFADKPTLRGTNSDGFANRRPIPPPSLMPNNEKRIPDLPPNKVINMEKPMERPPSHSRNANNNNNNNTDLELKNEKKKTLNTPSQNINLDRSFGDLYGRVRINESSFEYDKGYIPSITRILSGSNGRHDDISDILLRSVTATPNIQRPDVKIKTRPSTQESTQKKLEEKPPERKVEDTDSPKNSESVPTVPKKEVEYKTQERTESVTIKKEVLDRINNNQNEMTTQSSEFVNLPNVKEKENNVTKASSDEIWVICWNVHVYLVVLLFVILALFSIYKLIRYENDPHMFSKSYFLTIHLMLTVICVLRIFYLMYDPYNVDKSFNIFLYDFLHNFPLSLLATTFAVLILFLLKRTLTHLKVKTRPVFLVMFGVIHIFLCFCLSISETLGHFERASLIVCKPVFVLLALALGVSYLYLYRIIKNVLAKKSQNLSEICTQNISYASHITIAIALLFILLGCVQLYALFFIKVDRFSGEIHHHWILWGFELSVRILEISIISLLAIVVSLKMSQREKQTVGFPLFPCATSESSSDNMYPNNCNTNPNATNYSRSEMIMDNIPTEQVERPNLLKNAFQNDSFDKKSTLERYQSDGERFDRFERPKWGSDRFDSRSNVEQSSLNNFSQGNFERNTQNSSRSERNSGRKTYDAAKYYTKPKYDVEYNNDDYQQDVFTNDPNNVYSEPLDNQHQYERTRHEFERSDFDRRSRNSSNTSGRRSTTGRSRKNHPRPHLGVQTLPNHDVRHQVPETMLVDDQGFVRFRRMQEMEQGDKPKRPKKHNNDVSHYSDA